jgi:cytochrome c-type biogenesis protein CcmH/NrfG
VEFLPDELVEYDLEEFVPDEFVLDDVAPDSSVGFAGPSDAPPPHPAVQQPVTASWRPRERATRRTKTTRLGWIATALAAIFGLVAITRLGLIAATHSEAPQAAVMAAPLDPPAMLPPAMSSSPEPSVPPSVTTEAADAVDAVDLKHRAQQALEKGKLAAALDLGQQAVDADPSDAESWLILGATYLQRAKYKDARKCFSSCVDQATQGPVSECKALLR